MNFATSVDDAQRIVDEVTAAGGVAVAAQGGVTTVTFGDVDILVKNATASSPTPTSSGYRSEVPLSAAPYFSLGPASLVEAKGDGPISITWKLTAPMPQDFFQRARLAVI